MSLLSWGGWRRDWGARPAPGYRPGATALRVARELNAAPPDTSSVQAGALLRERVERHFLMHIVTVELVMRVPSVQPAHGVIRLRHAGTFRRGALVHSLGGAHDAHCAALARRVCEDSAVRAALVALDQRRCEIVGTGDAWELRIEPYGGCDVVNRLPAFRRHVRLGPVQAQALRQAAGALEAVLRSAA